MLVPAMPTLPLSDRRAPPPILDLADGRPDPPVLRDGRGRPDERSAAAAVTGVARTAGAAISPSLAGMCLAVPALAGLPFVLAGALKVTYDLLLGAGSGGRDEGRGMRDEG